MPGALLHNTKLKLLEMGTLSLNGEGVGWEELGVYCWILLLAAVVSVTGELARPPVGF